MAGLGGKNWAFEEEVTSSDVNGFLADQVVMRFADTATRTAGFGGTGEPVLAEGMLSYLDDANRVDYYNGSAWKPVSQVLQVVSTAKTDTFSVASSTFTDITGLSVSITPSATSNKILVVVDVKTGAANGEYAGITIIRDTTAIYQGDTAGSRIRATYGGNQASDTIVPIIGVYLDSPATVSATTYKVQLRRGTGTVYVNRSSADTDSASFYRTASSITVMEIAG